MSDTELHPIEVASLLRQLSDEILVAKGPTRNGLFLELHRLHDTIFRLTLESHPHASPDLSAQAFSVVNPLPSPQVVRELYRLDSQLVTTEIRNLYKHANIARNNMAHKARLERVTVSRSNANRISRLARLLADRLDPAQEGMPEISEEIDSVPPPTGQHKLLYLTVGLIAGISLSWAWFITTNAALTIATVTIMITIIAGLFLLHR